MVPQNGTPSGQCGTYGAPTGVIKLLNKTNKKAMLLQREPRDAAVNFDSVEFYNGIVRVVFLP